MLDVRTKKCLRCKAEINLHEEDFLTYKKATYHTECWIEWRGNMKKNKNIPRQELEKEAKGLTQEAKQKLQEELIKVNLYNFISDSYNITNFPVYFYNKIAEVLNGTRKGLMVRIPVEHLYEMWTMKMDYLNKIHTQTITMGKEIDGLNRVYYDLGVLVGSYDKYLQWKQKQDVVEKSKDAEQLHTQPRLTQHLKTRDIKKDEGKVNIYDLLDEI